MPVLIIETGPDKGQTIQLDDEGVYSLGRDPRAAVILNDELASRLHAKIRGKDGHFFIKDNDSANGTLVNDQRIETPVELKSGDLIAIGAITLSYLTDSDAGGAAGRTLGGFRLIQRLGRGGMGTVYRALQLSLNREVALKILSPELSRDPAFVEQFRKEARAAGQLNHPNIVQVYDVDAENNLTFYAMEFMTGGTVEDLLNRDGPLPLDYAVQLLHDAALGLHFAELKKIVHRDIKPDNLMLTEMGNVKIADLGLAHSSHDNEGGPGQILGTPHFISPEQARGQTLDTRSDLYSLGATFYRMLTGETMFHGESAEEIVRKQVKETPPSVRERRPDCPEEIAAIQAKLVAKDPAARFQSGQELVEAIEHARRGGQGSGVKIAAAVSLLVAIGLGVAFMSGLFDKPPEVDKNPKVTPSTTIVDAGGAAEREKMAEQLRLQERENEALRRFTELKDLEASLTPPEFLERLKSLAESFDGTDTADRVRDSIEVVAHQIAEREQQIANNRARIDAAIGRMVEQIDQAIERHSFPEAVAALEARGGVSDDLATQPPLQEAFDAQVTRLLTTIPSDVNGALDRAREQTASGDLSGAATAVAQALEMVRGSSALEGKGEVGKLLANLERDANEVEQQLTSAAELKRRQQLASDLKSVRSDYDWNHHADLLRNYRFGEAHDALVAVRSKLGSDEYRAYVDQAIADLAVARDYFDSFLAAAESETLKSASIDHPERNGLADIVGVAPDRQGIYLQVVRSAGSSRSLVGFDAFNTFEGSLDLLAGRTNDQLGPIYCALAITSARWRKQVAQIVDQVHAYDPSTGWTSAQQAALNNVKLTKLDLARIKPQLDAADAIPELAAQSRSLRQRIGREIEAQQLFQRGLEPFLGVAGGASFTAAADSFEKLIDTHRDTVFFRTCYDAFDNGACQIPLVYANP